MTSTDIDAERCANHGRRESIARCVECDRALCKECMIPTAVGFKCENCTDRPKPAAAAGGRGLKSLPQWVWYVVGGVVLVALPALLLASVVGDDDPGLQPAVGPAAGHEQIAVTFEGAGGFELAGVLDVPEGEGPHPGVVIVGGFGPTDRDGINSGSAVADPVYLDLATTLVDNGIAVLRYDKRGAGQSAPAPEPLLWDHRREDIVRAVAYLRERSETDPDRTAVIGHGEGGMQGLSIADHAVGLQGLVLLSTPGRPLVDVFAQDFTDTGDEAHMAAADELRRLVAALIATGEIPALDPEVSGSAPALEAMVPPGQESYLQGMYGFDPIVEAARVVSPTLIVHGGADPDLFTDTDVAPLQAALEEAGIDVDVLEVPNADQTLGLPPPGDATVDTGAVQGHGGATSAVARDQDALDEIVAWLKERLAA